MFQNPVNLSSRSLNLLLCFCTFLYIFKPTLSQTFLAAGATGPIQIMTNQGQQIPVATVPMSQDAASANQRAAEGRLLVYLNIFLFICTIMNYSVQGVSSHSKPGKVMKIDSRFWKIHKKSWKLKGILSRNGVVPFFHPAFQYKDTFM